MLFVKAENIEFFEDSTTLDGIRKIQLIVNDKFWEWTSHEYSEEYLSDISNYIQKITPPYRE